MSELSITLYPPPSPASGGATELLISDEETTIMWLGMSGIKDVMEILFVMTRADEI